MEIQTIAALACVAVRRVRYVVDQRLLPGMRARIQSHLAGKPRSYTPMEGFFIGSAAVLLNDGIQRGTVRQLMDRLGDTNWPITASSLKRVGLRSTCSAYEAIWMLPEEPALVQVGDGAALRLIFGEVDTGWIEAKKKLPLHDSYQPNVKIELDITRIRKRFRKASG